MAAGGRPAHKTSHQRRRPVPGIGGSPHCLILEDDDAYIRSSSGRCVSRSGEVSGPLLPSLSPATSDCSRFVSNPSGGDELMTVYGTTRKERSPPAWSVVDAFELGVLAQWLLDKVEGHGLHRCNRQRNCAPPGMTAAVVRSGCRYLALAKLGAPRAIPLEPEAGYWRDDMSQTRRASAATLVMTHRWSKSDSNPFWSHLPGSACLFRAELYRGGLEARHPCPAGRGATILPAQRTLASHKPGRRRPGSPDFSRMYVIPERVRSPFPPAANQPCRTKKLAH